jgi:peroxiredoxin family protein
MGLSNVFKQAAKTAITTFGDVAKDADYWAFASTAYNVSSGANVAVYSTVAGVKIILENFRVAQNFGVRVNAADFDVKAHDQQALIAATDLPGVTPEKNDRLVVDSVEWEVVNVFTDPATALWTCQIRKP